MGSHNQPHPRIVGPCQMCWWRRNLSLWWWRCWWQSLSPGRPSAPHTHTCRFTAAVQSHHDKSPGGSLQQTSLALYPNLNKPSTVVTPRPSIYSPHHIQHHQKLGEPEDTSYPDVWNNQSFRCFIIKPVMQAALAAACSPAHRCITHTLTHQWWTVQ